jgi:ribosomal protein S18 acetylase RimI-like enzyme
MNAAIAHGRASGLEGLWLSTSSLNTAAVNLYKKGGWKLDKVKTISNGGLTAQVINFRLNLVQ